MIENNIIRFPRPDDDLASETRMAQVARLAEDVAEQMDTGGAPMDILGLLGRIEQASAALWEIGQLTTSGAERLKFHELCVNVQVMISRIRATLERTA
ncbi:hypothetical protein CT676_42220 [Bradyrhizobium sp. MOS001]|jgi:hypothetical protein|uniref:hypothetical protein n=1 Tax=unclassified Bradyrhizobium TaxID=2631580 RepID=UPI001074BB79|nr:hypothetical protein [Bradyrhizobium sp. MOS001]TFW52572.1 hypothetical protein CT676_42220 [Bradyrhizobium sp. MOS001]